MPNPQHDDFESLLADARRGDPAAVEQLVRSYESEVRLVARLRLGPALRPYLDSVDLVQSVHRSLMLGLQQDKFDISSPEKLVALASTMVRRKVARAWRRIKRQQRYETGDSNHPAQVDLLASFGSSQTDPQLQIQIRDQIEHVCRDLSDTERQLIELRLEGHNTAAAARILGLDPDVLRVQLSRLRRRLRDAGLLTDWL
jgi:RNA polymerase sigma factor (sigma-70 family)